MGGKEGVSGCVKGGLRGCVRGYIGERVRGCIMVLEGVLLVVTILVTIFTFNSLNNASDGSRGADGFPPPDRRVNPSNGDLTL